MTSIRTTRFPLQREARMLGLAQKEAQMLAIVTPNGTTTSLLNTLARVSATARAIAVWIFERRIEIGVAEWHFFNDRLLRDVGVSPIEAEIARLYARWGASETIACNGRTHRGLGIE